MLTRVFTSHSPGAADSRKKPEGLMYDPNDTVAISATDEYDAPYVARRSVVRLSLPTAAGRRADGWSRFLAILLRALGAWPT